MECFILHHFPVMAQQFHVQLEVVTAGNVSRHEFIVAAIEKKFAEELDALSFGDVRLGGNQFVVV